MCQNDVAATSTVTLMCHIHVSNLAYVACPRVNDKWVVLLTNETRHTDKWDPPHADPPRRPVGAMGPAILTSGVHPLGSTTLTCGTHRPADMWDPALTQGPTTLTCGTHWPAGMWDPALTRGPTMLTCGTHIASMWGHPANLWDPPN